MINIPKRLGVTVESIRRAFDNFDFNLRVAMPGIIQSFDPVSQTVTVLVAVTEKIICDAPAFIEEHKSNVGSEAIPVLLDVPVVLPRAGGFAITMPIEEGDECLIVFADTCIDSWFSFGPNDDGTPRDQLSLRRHDLSDAFAIIGAWNQKRVLENYSEDSVQIRSDDGETCIEMKDGEVNVSYNDTKISLEDGKVTIIADEVNLSAEEDLRKLIDERLISLFNNHVHTDSTVAGQTGTPTVPLVDTLCATTKVTGL